MNIFTRLFFPIFILEKYIIYCQIGTQNSCYDASGKARTCITYPKNAAYEALPGRKIVATNTCGTPPAQFCVIGPQTKCQICNASDINNSYPPNKMIDLHNPSNPTWWQSQNWWETNQLGLSTLSSPLTVNVTVSLNKHYLLSGGVYLTFQSVRPKQMVLYRSIDYGKTWKAYQFYSKNCTISYGMQADPPITNTNRFDATCSEKFSSETPFANGVVFFDPRKTRYTTGQYFNSDVHQYLKASDIRVRLEYPGTDGREYINQEETLNQYYYAISDFQIDARCDCQGHAEFCDTVNGTEVCDCKHFTTGRDCDMCLPLYNNRPWTAGNATDANECQKCQCYDHASSCVYSSVLGHGICQSCQHNTQGVKCDQCVEKFYRNVSTTLNHPNACIPCACYLPGTRNNESTCTQVATPTVNIGQCDCKTGVYGLRCDQCLPGRWGFIVPPEGTCFDCTCNRFGTIDNNQTCNQYTGQCLCKPNTQGRICHECKDAFYSFPTNMTADCIPCGCDIGGGFPVCNKMTGICTCRQGITGTKCTVVSAGYYFPNFTHVKFEPELASLTGAFSYYWLLKKYESFYTGIGHVRLNAGQRISFTFQVPVSTKYFISIRYALFPLSWYNLVSLYGAETLIWSGSNRIIDHISADDNPGLWQLTFTISASSGSNVRTKLFTVSSLLVGEALSWMDSVSSQLNLGEIYTVSINYFRVGSNYGSPWPFLIDAVILMPDLSLVSYYNLVSSSVKQSIDQCYSQSRALSSIPLMAGICRQYTFTISLLIYNGSLPCDCDSVGSNNPLTCVAYGGQCSCKVGYGGRRCNHCLAGYYGNPRTGCIPCSCSTLGSITPICNQTTGRCFCKTNVQGLKCDQCRYGTFDLSQTNPDGCQICFGFGHLTACESASGYARDSMTSSFAVGELAGWRLKAEDGTNLTSTVRPSPTGGILYVNQNPSQVKYFEAPAKFLGNQLMSYGQLLNVELRFLPSVFTSANPSWHVRLIGGGLTAMFKLFPEPSINVTKYSVRLHEKFAVNGTALQAFLFKAMIGQLAALHIGVNYYIAPSSLTFLSVSLETAKYNATSATTVTFVENATCFTGYEQLSCQRCKPGYTRAFPNGGPLINCVPCSCNNRSTDCDPQTGICRNCRPGTTGDHCENCMPNLLPPNCDRCTPGYWRFSLSGCQPCNCYLPGTVGGNSNQCDQITGQCFCNSTMNVGGRQCNQCKQNAYNISFGELQCKECPPCYGLIEQGMVLLRYQMSLLQIEVTALLQDPSLSSDTSPFYQTLTTIGVLVNNLTSRAVIATSTVSSLDSLWSSLQNNINILNNHLTGSTTTALRLSLNKTDEIILRYNQTVASYSVVENLVRISFSLLNGTVSTRISQQASAITQLQALQSEIERYLTTAQTALAQATSIRNNTITNIASSVNIASTSANLSLRHRTDVTNLNVLLIPLRSSIIQTRDQALRVQTFAQQMHRNASQALAFANYTRGNVTVVLTDYSQTITTLDARTTSLSTQRSSLATQITATNQANNGIALQITVLKQQNTILDSQISTTERRSTAVQARAQAAQTTASAAVSSSLNTESSALVMLNTVRNFKNVTQKAAEDAASALTQVDAVRLTTTSAINTTQQVNAQLSPIKGNATLALSVSNQANQVILSEQTLVWVVLRENHFAPTLKTSCSVLLRSYSSFKTVDAIYQQATRLQTESVNALATIQRQQVQQYIDTNLNPTLQLCRNYTTQGTNLISTASVTLNDATRSHSTAQNVSTQTSLVSALMSNLPSIDANLLLQVKDNIVRIRGAYTALNLTSALAVLRAGYQEQAIKIADYGSRITLLKAQINGYKLMYDSVVNLNCRIPSQVP